MHRRHDIPTGAAAIVLDVGFTNGLEAIRQLVALGVPVTAVDHRPNALGFKARGVTKRLAPDPARDEAGFVAVLERLAAAATGPTVVIATHDGPLAAFSKQAARLAPLIEPNPPWAELEPLMTKATQARLAQAAGVPAPQTFLPRGRAEIAEAAAAVRYPAIVKPSVGVEFKARMGVQVIEAAGPQELIDACAAIAACEDEPVVQEVIPGGDDALWTVGACTGRDGAPLGLFCGRKLMQDPPLFGTCRVGEARWDDDAVASATRMLAAMRFHGVSQTEFKRDPRDGAFKLIEVNLRPWKWHSLARRCGVPLVQMAFLDALGLPVERAVSGPGHDGLRWVSPVPHWKAGRRQGESIATIARPLIGRVHDPIWSLRDPAPSASLVAGQLLAPLLRRRRRR